MSLQNRVTPFSQIEAVPYHGLYMGNRGILHNERKELVTQGWRTKRWLICELTFKNRHREVMQPHLYTELFFLDEVVALAAGHRPCMECRRSAFASFADSWSRSSGRAVSVQEIDAALHLERVPAMRGRKRWQACLAALPHGTMVVSLEDPRSAWLKLETGLFEWSHAGYIRIEDQPANLLVDVLTPYSTVQALRGGYSPYIHPSARN
jgi:hypothetical protein